MRVSVLRWVAAGALALASGGAVAVWLPDLLRRTIGPHCIEGQYLLRGTDGPDVVLDSFSCPLPAAEIAVTWLVTAVVALLAIGVVTRVTARRRGCRG
jgi:hypothetical protein